jgi:hypothetical protein
MQTDDISRFIGVDTRTQWQPLRCGPLAMHFDPTTAALRTIRLGDREVVRSIYVAVRDRNWGTVAPQIADLELTTVTDGGFRLTFTTRCREREIDFRWQGEIVGEADGRLRYSMNGDAQSTFLRNRLGFCILYPIRECAGQPCIVTTADGAMQQYVFPDLISPHQPFLNMRAIRHEALPGVWTELTFEGDVFEMEDQRNWTDASYKIYCPPLALPFPVEVPQGTHITQAVTLTLTGELPPALSTPDEQEVSVTLRLIETSPIALPKIGFGIASHGTPLSAKEKERLQWGVCSHLRVDLKLAAPDWEAQLKQAIQDAYDIRVRLEIALFLEHDNLEKQLAAVVDAIKRGRLWPPVARWLIFSTDPKAAISESHVRAARKALVPFELHAQFGSGTDASFAELNRSRPPKEALDFICWSINPQVHDFDTASILENLAAQAETIRSARAIYGDLPIVISPVTLKPRFNPNATGPEAPPLPGELPPQVDERQCTLIGAAWTLLSLKHLCESGVHSITYYETTGWRGIMETEAGTLLPERFASTPGAVFPLYEIFVALREFLGSHTLRLESSASSKVDGLALRGSDYTVLCANLTPQTQVVRIMLPTSITRAQVNQVDTQKRRLFSHPPYIEFEFGNPVEVRNGILEWELPAYAFARVDWPEEGRDLSEVGDD